VRFWFKDSPRFACSSRCSPTAIAVRIRVRHREKITENRVRPVRFRSVFENRGQVAVLVQRFAALQLLFSVFSYSNRCLNPFIYATQYDIVRRWWKVVMNRVIRGKNAGDSSLEQAAMPSLS